MSIYAIADLHLDGGQNKAMDMFGKNWEGHAEKIRNNWIKKVSDEDLVLIAGDISWAMQLKDAKPDLDMIGSLPGKKVIIKGNHDFWHDSLVKTRSALPENVYFIQNDVLRSHGFAISGSRGWKQKSETDFTAEDEKIYQRELGRLKLSLDMTKGERTIVMMHYPPYSLKKEASEFTELIGKYNVECVVFGHIHGFTKKLMQAEGYFDVNIGGIPYILSSCDYIGFDPIKIV